MNTIDDLYVHDISHIARVVETGLELKRLHPIRYVDVDEHLLRLFLKWHDNEKLEPFFLKRFFRRYGTDFETLPEQDKIDAHRDTAMLNAKGAKNARAFFEAHNQDFRFIDRNGKYTALAMKYFEIESIADKVDRGLSPVSAEEFGRKKMAPASQYLTDPTEKKLAESLEVSRVKGHPSPYARATIGLGFWDFRAENSRPGVLGLPCVIGTMSRVLH